MLLLGLTRNTLTERLRKHEHREFRVAPGWFLTVIIDPFLSAIHVANDKVVVGESLRCRNGESLIHFLTAKFDFTEHNLEIIKAPVSGRPAYFHQNARGEFFFSTHISLLRLAGVGIKENADILPELCIYRTIAPPRTLYADIQQLAASGVLNVRQRSDGVTVSVDQGYKPPALEGAQHPTPNGEAHRAAEILSCAIQRISPTRSSMAVLLSGGTDSSILAQIAKIELGVKRTYSTVYPFQHPKDNLEKEYALSAAKMLGTEHVLFEPSVNDYLLGFVEAIAAAETPIHHLQSVLLHLLFRKIPVEHRVLLLGEAADTVFGTGFQYQLNRFDKFADKLLLSPWILPVLFIFSLVSRRVAGLLEILQTRKRLPLSLSDPANPIWMLGSYGDYAWVKSEYNASPAEVISDRYRAIHWCEDYDINTAFALYAMNYSEVSITTAIWSKLAEVQGKVLYYPFAEKQLLDLAFAIPWKKKLSSPKQVIRQLARQFNIPESIITRPKQSFGISPNRWAGRNAVFEPLIPLASKVIDEGTLRRLQRHSERPAMTLWTLLNYAVWKRLFILGEPKELILDELRDGLRARQCALKTR
jgi:asparagine synthetase B (glutamine-hydrolysing)